VPAVVVAHPEAARQTSAAAPHLVIIGK
jgi:hypothetical protein